MKLKTTVENVQLEAGRMVVYTELEEKFEYHEDTLGWWMPWTYKGSGELTWERKGGQWKLVRAVYGADAQVDPKWEEARHKAVMSILQAEED